MEIEIRQISITDTDCECVVNAANRHLLMGSGVCGAIFKEAGERRLQEACNKIGGCKTGDAVITPGFKLCKYIVHAVGPVYEDGKHHEKELLYSTYINSLNLAYENKCMSIAFPLISAGIYGYPETEAFQTALDACKDWGLRHENTGMKVIFAIPEDRKYRLGLKLLESLYEGLL